MAKTKSRKQRDHVLRNSGRDVTLFRNNNEFSTHERKTKTKREKLDKKVRKYKQQFLKGEQTNGIAFLFAKKHLAKCRGLIK